MAAAGQRVREIGIEPQKFGGCVETAMVRSFQIDGWYVHGVLHHAADAS
jgi:hypothetical protein